MQKIYTEIIGTEVINAQNGKRLARVQDLLIDPENGKVIAVIVNLKKNLIISVMDIAKWGKNIQINDPHSIIDGFEILKVKKIQEEEIKIIKSSVKTEEKKYIGTVHNYYIESDIGNLSKILTRKKFLFFHYDERIIDYREIVEIKKGEIIIKADAKVEKLKKARNFEKRNQKLAIDSGAARLKEIN